MEFIIDELVLEENYPLAAFDTREDAEHELNEILSNGAVEVHGEAILDNEKTYFEALEELKKCYRIREEN